MQITVAENHDVQNSINNEGRWDLLCREEDKVFQAVPEKSFENCPFCGAGLQW